MVSDAVINTLGIIGGIGGTSAISSWYWFNNYKPHYFRSLVCGLLFIVNAVVFLVVATKYIQFLAFTTHQEVASVSFSANIWILMFPALSGALGVNIVTSWLQEGKRSFDINLLKKSISNFFKIWGKRKYRRKIDAENITDKEGALLKLMIEKLRTDPEVDQRWVSIAETHLQQGIMAANRAINKPNKF